MKIRLFIFSFFGVLQMCQSGWAQKLELLDRTLFQGVVTEGVVYFEAKDDPQLVTPQSMNDFVLVDVMVVTLEEHNEGTHAVYFSLIPKRSGLLIIPELKFKVDEKLVTLPAKQVAATKPYLSKDMELKIVLEKDTVYVGEPVRVDVTWQTSFSLATLRDMDWNPSFFHAKDIKVTLPRSKSTDEEAKVGLPMGGRRVIAERKKVPKSSKKASNKTPLGEVCFSLFVQFEEAGSYVLGGSKLSCSHLFKVKHRVGNYAASFNNGLFLKPERDEFYERIYAESKASEVVVLPLPEDQMLPIYSGLVKPVWFEVGIRPNNLEVGGILEVLVRVKSETCSELLRLPDLSKQRGLSYAFYVSEEYSEKWLEDGREFIYRVRPLRAGMTAFPSLSFQVLDSNEGMFEVVDTGAIPLKVEARGGKRYFNVKSLKGVYSPVEGNKEGVWFNRRDSYWENQVSFMMEFMNDWFWWLLAVGPVVFLMLVTWMKEQYRRASDQVYAKKILAYELFIKKLNDRHVPSEDKGLAFRLFLADLLGCDASGFTKGDADLLLRQRGVPGDVRERVGKFLSATDRALYAKGRENESSVSPFASRDVGMLKALGSSLVKGLLLLMFFMAMLAFPEVVVASEDGSKAWEEGRRFFSQGLQEAETSTLRAEEYFASAALSYECAAESRKSVGKAWYNAGNAWFKANEPGRALAAYLRAEHFLPFDEQLKESIYMIRALNVDGVSLSRERSMWLWYMGWIHSPEIWRRVGFLFVWSSFWVLLLFWFRYRSKWLSISVGGLLLVLGGVGLSLIFTSVIKERRGVVITEEVLARKGPSYAYQSAFKAPLHQALEVKVRKHEKDWLFVELNNGDVCWLPSKSVGVF